MCSGRLLMACGDNRQQMTARERLLHIDTHAHASDATHVTDYSITLYSPLSTAAAARVQWVCAG